MGFHNDFMELYSDSMGYSWDIPSGKRLHSELERSTMLLMGKSTISMGHSFQFATCNSHYQRGKTLLILHGSADFPSAPSRGFHQHLERCIGYPPVN